MARAAETGELILSAVTLLLFTATSFGRTWCVPAVNKWDTAEDVVEDSASLPVETLALNFPGSEEEWRLRWTSCQEQLL